LQNAKGLASCSDKNPNNPVKIEGAAPQTIDAEREFLSRNSLWPLIAVQK
jgi:hypothetical protein